MVITEGHWEPLAAGHHVHGKTELRIYPESSHDLFIAVRHKDNHRMLTLRVSSKDADAAVKRLQGLPQTRGLEMQLVRLAGQASDLQVVLTDNQLREVFNPLASDIASAIADEVGSVAAIYAAVGRFEHWQRMLERLASGGLTNEERRGLFGELSILRDCLFPWLPSPDAVTAWTGPTGANQDFQLQGTAIEVKTSSGKEPQTLVITNERELDRCGIPILILAHLSVDERRGGSGESLNMVVDGIRVALSSSAARNDLDDRLVRIGYLQEQRELYEEPRYTTRKQHFWRVTGDFPRLTEADLRRGVGDCRYRISTAGLDEYLVSEEQIAEIIRGTQHGQPNS